MSSKLTPEETLPRPEDFLGRVLFFEIIHYVLRRVCWFRARPSDIGNRAAAHARCLTVFPFWRNLSCIDLLPESHLLNNSSQPSVVVDRRGCSFVTRPYGVLTLQCRPAMMQLRREMLTNCGYEVVSAMRLNVALGLLENHQFDAVLVGQTIPPYAKFQMVATAKKNGTPVVLIHDGVPDAMDGAADCDGRSDPKLMVELIKENDRCLDTSKRVCFQQQQR